MEVIEIVEYNVNPKTNILEVTFRLMDDSEDMVREDKMDYSIAEEYGYNLGPSISNRKLSCVIQLSDPNDYEGGDLQLNNGSGVVTIEKKKGRVVFFSSFVLHRVTPVTNGTRISLVTWLSGRNLR